MSHSGVSARLRWTLSTDTMHAGVCLHVLETPMAGCR